MIPCRTCAGQGYMADGSLCRRCLGATVSAGAPAAPPKVAKAPKTAPAPKKPHGGKRDGAGRKPIDPAAGALVVLPVRVPGSVKATYDAEGAAGAGLARGALTRGAEELRRRPRGG